MRLLVLLILPVLLMGCNVSASKSQQAPTARAADNLLYTAKWKAVTDQLGSSHTPETVEIADSLMEVNFTLKKQEESEIVFIELVCALDGNLDSTNGIELSYKCETPLVVKLSQSDFGQHGDESYAHYQFVVPASESIRTERLTFDTFTQPDWTPDYSKGKAMNLAHVNAIYLTPQVDAATGGSAALGVKALYVLKN